MSPMTPERHERIQDVFMGARGCDANTRGAYLEVSCRGDADLRAEVEALLAHDGAPTVPAGRANAPGGFWPVDGGAGLVGRSIGGFGIKGVIAAGGMGTVYEALQEHPRRVVALKVMRAGIASRAALRRFEYESQILARLRHPGIAQIYQAGTHEEQGTRVPYFAMEYIPGARPITEHAEAQRLGTRDRLRLFASVCDAVHHGHQKGIIHRDLKPPNILVDSSGQPKIIDFGVARSTDSDLAVTTLQTEIGQLVGTVQYMSPEQCHADPHDLDTRSDVYSLGVVLYELLSGHSPYPLAGESILRATRMIAEVEPRRLSGVDRSLRGDVETIVLRALEKTRDRRYQSAAELASDIRRYLANQPIEARSPSVVYQFSMFARRHRALCGATGAVGVVLVAALGVISVLAAREQAAGARARASAERLTATINSLRRYIWSEFERFQSSVNLIAALRDDELPGHAARTVAMVGKPGAEGDRALVFLDDTGSAVRTLDTRLTIPEWADAVPWGARRFNVAGALLEDVTPSNPGRELVVIMNNGESQCGVLRVYDLELRPLAELWNAGGFRTILWNAGRPVLVVTCSAKLLPFYVPEFARYDSAGCPGNLERPTIAFAIRPENIRGVLFPLAGDAAHPPATIEWAVCREPLDMSNKSGPWVGEIHSAEAPEPRRTDADALLYVQLRERQPDADGRSRAPIFGWAHIGSDGQLLESFTHDGEPDEDEPRPITHRLKRLDARAIVAAQQKAEPAALASTSLAECVGRLREDRGVSGSDLDAAIGAASAMYGNWRWLHRQADIASKEPGATGLGRALAWAHAAVDIHRERCPEPSACRAGWYPLHVLGAVLYRAGAYEDALRVLRESERLWAELPLGDGLANAADAAFISACLHRLGRLEEAWSERARARALLAERPTYEDGGRAAREALAETRLVFAAGAD